MASILVSPIRAGTVIPAGGKSATVFTRAPLILTGGKTVGISCQAYPIPAGVLAMGGMMGEYHTEDAASRPAILQLVAGYDQQAVVDKMAPVFGVDGYYAEQAPESLAAFLDTHLLTIDSTPNNIHLPDARAIFGRDDAGERFLYLEKPPAESERAAAEIALLEQRFPGQTAVVSQNRWWDMNLEGRHMIQNGDIGDTVEAEVEYLQDWMNWGCPAYWRTVKGVGGEDMELADGGIGKLLDIAQHAVDIVTWVAGMRIAKVENAFVRQNVMEREDPSGGGTFVQGSGEKAKVKVGPGTKFLGDDTIIVVATLANGATLKVTVTQTQAGHKNHLKWRFYGTKGSLEFDTDMAEILKHYGFGNRMEVINRSPGALASRDSMASWLQEGLRILNTKNAPFAWYTPDMHGQGWREVHRRGLLSFALYAQLRHHGILGAENRKDLFMVPTAEEAWAAMRAIKAMYLAAASGRSQDVTYDLTKELK